MTKTFADVDGFINMLRGACEDADLNRTLELLLSQPDQTRISMLRALITTLRERQAPKPLIEAFICLMDDHAAEKAYAVIYQCGQKLAPQATIVDAPNKES